MDYIENTHETAERVKQWWKKYGNIISAIIVIIMIAILGMQYWHKHTYKVAIQASAIYESLLSSVETKKQAQTEGLANQLINQYANTPYAKFAALLLAKQAINNHHLSLAEMNLQWTVSHAKSRSIKAIAQLRLARVLLAENKTKQALSTLNSITEKNIAATAALIKGDVYLALKQQQQAKVFYLQALQGMSKDNALYHYTQMKLYRL